MAPERGGTEKCRKDAGKRPETGVPVPRSYREWPLPAVADEGGRGERSASNGKDKSIRRGNGYGLGEGQG